MKKWTGRIEVNLKEIDNRFDIKKMTGFNLGVQDVDRPCVRLYRGFWIRDQGPGKKPLYLLYETYPKLVHDTARYADIEFVQ